MKQTVFVIYDLQDMDLNSMKFIYCSRKRRIIVFIAHKSFPGKCRIFVICARTYKLTREMTMLNMNFDFHQMQYRKDKLVLRAHSELFIVNILSCKSKFCTITPSEQVFLTKKKDYNSSPSDRWRMKYGLTFVSSDMSSMGINKRNQIVRLKNGNFIVKFDYKELKIYWNVTAERIEKVFRLDFPSEIPQFFKDHILHSAPNINYMKKFYLKKFNLETMT
jgi:hypothetical protein